MTAAPFRCQRTNERAEQAESNAPGLTFAVQRGGALVDAHDQPYAALHVLIGEAHAVADPEVGRLAISGGGVGLGCADATASLSVPLDAGRWTLDGSNAIVSCAHFTDRGHPFHADRGRRFTLMADGVQRVRVSGVHRISGVRDGLKPPLLSTPANIAGVGNTAPKAMLD